LIYDNNGSGVRFRGREGIHRWPVEIPEGIEQLRWWGGEIEKYVSLAEAIFSFAIPAAQSGGEYEPLILRIWATRVGSFGIQFPMTTRPPENMGRRC
jgi:hypothetical protein